MQSCPHCRHEATNGEKQCPHCGMDLLTSSDDDRLSTVHSDASVDAASSSDKSPHEPIARFANIAEAGYFHSELEGRLNCEVRLNTQDHFDAPSASWWSDYVLTVPATDASEAVVVLKQLVTETDQAEFLDFGTNPSTHQAISPDDESTPQSRIHWTPIVLTLAAGTLVVWATKQAQLQVRGPAGREANRVSLWDTMRESEQPWVQRLDEGRRRRELSVDPDRNVATLREDTDGDGIFDRVSRLPLNRQ